MTALTGMASPSPASTPSSAVAYIPGRNFEIGIGDVDAHFRGAFRFIDERVD